MLFVCVRMCCAVLASGSLKYIHWRVNNSDAVLCDSGEDLHHFYLTVLNFWTAATTFLPCSFCKSLPFLAFCVMWIYVRAVASFYSLKWGVYFCAVIRFDLWVVLDSRIYLKITAMFDREKSCCGVCVCVCVSTQTSLHWSLSSYLKVSGCCFDLDSV